MTMVSEQYSVSLDKDYIDRLKLKYPDELKGKSEGLSKFVMIALKNTYPLEDIPLIKKISAERNAIDAEITKLLKKKEEHTEILKAMGGE